MLIAVEFVALGLLVGGGPCMLGCTILPLILVTGGKMGWKKGAKSLLFFSAARLCTYAVLGLGAGWEGGVMDGLYCSSRWEWGIKILGGGYIGLLGIMMVLGRDTHFGLCYPLMRNASMGDSALSFFILGLIVGILPCPPMLAFLANIAMKATGPLEGGIWGLCFGIGTSLWLLILAGASSTLMISRFLRDSIGYKFLQRWRGIAVIAIGGETFIQAMVGK